jgi:hypothetical protein
MAELRINKTGERVMVASSTFAVLGAVVIFSETLRGRVAGVLSGNAPRELAMVSAQAQRAMRVATEMVGFEGADHVSIGIFGIAAIVLVVLMLRA